MTDTTRADRQNASVLREIPRAVYRFLHNKVVGLLIILAMAFLSLLGTLISQMPAGLRDDPTEYVAWMEEARARYGGWTGILDAVGAFQMYSSVPFVTVSLLLMLSIIACTTHRIPQLWKRATAPRVRVSEGFFRHAKASATVRADSAEAQKDLVSALKKRGFRVLSEGSSLYADRFRWGPFGTALAHTAFVLIIIGVLVSSTLGFERYVPVPVGTEHEVGGNTNLSLEATSFSDTYNVDGSPADYVSQVVLRHEGNVVGESEVRVNTPLTWNGYRVHQTSFGTAVLVTVTDAEGAIIFDRGVTMDWTTQDGIYSVGSFQLPSHDVVVSMPASGATAPGMAPGQVTVVVYPTGVEEALAVEVLSPGESAQFEGLTFAFERETKYTGLTVARNPGSMWVWVGSILLTIGMTMTFGFPHRRLWARVRPEQDGSLISLAMVDRMDPIQERRFAEIVESLGEATEFSIRKESEHA